MATYNNNCVGCGCGPAIPEPCITPPPVCPDPQPCTEIINAECVVYTGPALTCKDNPIIPQNSSLVEALDAIVDYICLGACCAIPAVNEIDDPDYLLLCVDSTATCVHQGLLYNWFTINTGTPGDGRVPGGLVNIDPLDNQINTWRVPNNNDWYSLALALDPLATQTPWSNHAGGKAKSTTCWSLPNSGATNESGLGIMPTVVRNGSTGVFESNTGQATVYWSATANTGGVPNAYGVDYLSDTISPYVPGSYTFGYKIRLVRPIDCNESDGDFISNAYKDNSGNLYNARVIGTLVWLTSDLIDTKYNNNTPISNIIFNAPWSTATTGAWCYPDNNDHFTITYVDGCEQVKIAFEDFLQFIPTSTQAFVVEAGNGIQVDSTTIGAQTTFTITNTDPGSAVTLASAGGTETLVNDGVGAALAVKGLTPGPGITLLGSATDIVISNSDPGSGVTLADAGTTTHESLVNDGTGPSLAVKGLKAGLGISIASTATDILISGLSVSVISTTLPAISIPLNIVHPLGIFASLTVYLPKDGLAPYEVLVHGVDYAYSTQNASFDIIPLSVKAENADVYIKIIGS
jgi:uncharacterized protein (TIGR02145 family)